VQRVVVVTVSVVALVVGCSSGPRGRPDGSIDPDVKRARIAALLPAGIADRNGWAVDIFAAFDALRVPPSDQNVCAAIAVAEQETGLRVDPSVPGLARIARRELLARGSRYKIAGLFIDAALELRSPDGRSYRQRLDAARTEKDLSDLYEDFIAMVPLGRRLFADLNPIHTAGPMQVSIDFAERHAAARRYPYPYSSTLRNEVFTRRGGLYFGIAHLLDYAPEYDRMIYRFADFNAGQYASRNAAFQAAVSLLSGVRLDLDGDLVRHGASGAESSRTELALRSVAIRLGLNPKLIREDLDRGESGGFGSSRSYLRTFELAARQNGTPLPRAILPKITISSPKISRHLTTEWFARRVEARYNSCLAR
jgi:hypothetical protein